jgi:HK97 family phage portal protein
MRIAFEISRDKRNNSPENAGVPVSADNFLAYFGVKSGGLPTVTIDTALKVPAVAAAVNFLSSSLANLPLHLYRQTENGAERAGGPLQRILNEAPNAEWSSFGLRKYLWQQVFTGGRGLAWIERAGTQIVAVWPMDPTKTQIKRRGFAKVYEFEGKADAYPAGDVIDIPFMLKTDQIASYSPILLGEKAIQLALAMNSYAANHFAGGGVPPLALEGPLPQGPEAFNRAMRDIKRAVDQAKESDQPFFGMPPGHTLKPIGLDPDKGQMTEAMLFQIQELARIYNLPPVFLQDLSRGTFANTEQQDLHLVKHLISSWAKALEEELNLKLFGAKRNVRYVEHNLDGLQRGDFKSRMEGLARSIQTGLRTPNEARALENLPAHEKGDDLLIQGATVPLGSQPVDAGNGGTDDEGV